MSLIAVLLVLVIVGVGLWLVNTIIPMEPWMRKVINVVAGIFVVVWLLQAFGLIGGRTLTLTSIEVFPNSHHVSQLSRAFASL